MTAVRLLGPETPDQIRLAGRATLAPPAEGRKAFDALFESYFYGGKTPPTEPSAKSKDERTTRPGGEDWVPPRVVHANRSGQVASGAAMSSLRRFEPTTNDADLRRLSRNVGKCLPTRRRLRFTTARRGDRLDLRSTIRDIVRHDGDIARLVHTSRPRIPRPVILMIDISGSMKSHTEDHLRFAHAMTHASLPVETYLIGTRLTALTPILRRKNIETALAEAAAYTEDWDGGTRIGSALSALLAVRCQASQLRGALVFVLSDGLERGDHSEMVAACRRIAGLARRFVWLTPLALDPGFRPRTAALRAILPLLDALGPSGDIAALCDYFLSLDGDGGRAVQAGPDDRSDRRPATEPGHTV